MSPHLTMCEGNITSAFIEEKSRSFKSSVLLHTTTLKNIILIGIKLQAKSPAGINCKFWNSKDFNNFRASIICGSWGTETRRLCSVDWLIPLLKNKIYQMNWSSLNTTQEQCEFLWEYPVMKHLHSRGRVRSCKAPQNTLPLCLFVYNCRRQKMVALVAKYLLNDIYHHTLYFEEKKLTFTYIVVMRIETYWYTWSYVL